MVATNGERLSIRQSLLELAGEFVHAHGGNVGDNPQNSTGAGGEKQLITQHCSRNPGKNSTGAVQPVPGEKSSSLLSSAIQPVPGKKAAHYSAVQ
jgi:hypothetical protein